MTSEEFNLKLQKTIYTRFILIFIVMIIASCSTGFRVNLTEVVSIF